MNILIGGAWPYANGSLHIGHIAALLPGDILARYHRAKGDNVIFVSGTDCHGTPVSIRAKQENRTPEDISEKYHNEFYDCFSRLGFSYDLYGKTSSDDHKKFVIDFHKKLYSCGHVYEKTVSQLYCEKCRQFLPDRFVTGLCPNCGKNARGDQCEACGSVLGPEDLISPRCSICLQVPLIRSSNHLFLAVTDFKDELENYIESHKSWRKNAYEMSKRYIREGLCDRSLTRDLDWGIDVPKKGFDGKKIYIWAENVLGYLSACNTLCEQKGLDFYEFWNSSRQYYVHGKDNIPFHTIILPSLLLGRTDKEYKLPDEIVSSEHLTLEGRKISTSGKWAIWANDILERYDPDSIRYFLISNGPEKRDTDFTWREFINSHNGELLGAYGNFVNRSIVFIQKFFDNKVPDGACDPDIAKQLISLFPIAGELIEQGRFKEALDTLFAFIRTANKFFDTEQPWITIKSDTGKCKKTIYTCIEMIADLSVLLDPFLPFSSCKVKKTLRIDHKRWEHTEIQAGLELGSAQILFERIDKKIIAEEEARLEKTLY
jgi:methionyl-tRNA synthetase